MSDKKNELLGMNFSTASYKLKKSIMFKFIQMLEFDKCFQCNEKIETVEHLSVEHKTPWMSSNNPIESFFDINNIAFSHLTCNVGARVHPLCVHERINCPECRKISRIKFREANRNQDSSQYRKEKGWR